MTKDEIDKKFDETILEYLDIWRNRAVKDLRRSFEQMAQREVEKIGEVTGKTEIEKMCLKDFKQNVEEDLKIRREFLDQDYKIMKAINGTTTHELFSFMQLIDSGLNIVIKVKDRKFCLVYEKEINKKYYILTREVEENPSARNSWDIIGEETDYKEAELCFITEVSRCRDLSYEEVEDESL